MIDSNAIRSGLVTIALVIASSFLTVGFLVGWLVWG